MKWKVVLQNLKLKMKDDFQKYQFKFSFMSLNGFNFFLQKFLLYTLYRFKCHLLGCFK